MSQSEVNVITHLIEVEQRANGLVKNAQNSSNEKLCKVRHEAEVQFNLEYEKLIQSLEANYTQKINLIAENHRQKMDEYIQSVKNTVQNKNNFRKVLQKILQK